MEEKHKFADWINIVSSGKYETPEQKTLRIKKHKEAEEYNKKKREKEIADKKKKDDDDMTCMIASFCHF